ncbi:chondroitinase-B domain-containing protein [Thalassotalea hakodatensis]|uniref:chondroitinase-B domain-containing protein n=1 Tax=Thalassotalea hakodatensis TaxID=3030492 RepID=UPI0025736B57|nr:chondroitinase-B domain-containing protein [Thalassotalea hakodatensis]
MKAKLFIYFIICLVVLACSGALFFQYYFQKPFSEAINIKPYKMWQSELLETKLLNPNVPSAQFWFDKPVGPKAPIQWNPTHNNSLYVNSEKEIIAALKKAKAGETIHVLPGTYRFTGHSLNTKNSGTLSQPIVFMASHIGDVTFEFDLKEGLLIAHPFWRIGNIQFKGVCEQDYKCEHALHVVGQGHNTHIENNVFLDFNSPIKVNQFNGEYPDKGLIKHNTFIYSRARKTASPVTAIDIVAANDWLVSQNFISDFTKAKGDHVSYAMFFKGNGQGNVAERNVVFCEWLFSGGQRVGVSIGGGGTGHKFCRDGSCAVEQSDSIIRNNLIAHCPNDVGIYVNKGKNSIINNNVLYKTRGMDIAFEQSSTTLLFNVYDGRVFVKHGANIVEHNNAGSVVSAMLLKSEVEHRYINPASGNFIALDDNLLPVPKGLEYDLGLDICGIQRSKRVSLFGMTSTLMPSCKLDFTY